MTQKERLGKYTDIMAIHEWVGSILHYCCICDFCKRARTLSKAWVEATKKDPALVYMD